MTTTTSRTTTGTTTGTTMTERARHRWARRLRAAASSTHVRIMLAMVVLVAVAGAAAVGVARSVLFDRMDDRVRLALVQEAQEFQRFLQLGRDGAGRRIDRNVYRAGVLYLQRSVLDQGEAVLVTDRRRGSVQSAPTAVVGALLDSPDRVGAWERERRPVFHDWRTPEGPAIALVVPIERDGTHEGMFVVARFTAPERAVVTDALQSVAWTIGIVVLLAIPVAWLIASRLVRPLRQMTQTAHRINEEDLSRRIPERPGHDEVAVLIRTFNSMLDRLEQASDAQRTFLADVSHDLRTPLTIMSGNLGHLDSGLISDEERPDVVGLLREEVARMGRLVEDLTVLARAQRPDFLQVGPVDLADLAAGVHRRATAIAGPEWRMSPGVGVIEADAERLTEAALNLVTNAARYSPAGEPITVGTALDGDHAVVWVGDSGPGVPEELRTAIVERHVRGSERRRTGSGLGLAIVRAVAEAHGGRLVVGSCPDNGGARFEMRLPVSDDPLPEER